MPTSFLSLNDDALLAIFSFLYGKEALAVALTSRRLHDLAIPRVAASAKCCLSQDFPRFCDYMLQGPRTHARYLEVLDVRWGVVPGATNPCAGIPHEHLLADLLATAQNRLSQLTLELPPIPESPGAR